MTQKRVGHVSERLNVVTDDRYTYVKSLFRLLKYIMLKSDISSNQMGGSINVARLIIDSSLISLSVNIFKNGPSSLIK